MISLRQHIFSLIAVFVALAIGIAAGSTVVRGPLLDSTRARLESAEEIIAAERAENDRLNDEVAQLDEWAAVGPALVLGGHALADAVVLVVAGDVSGDAVVGMMRAIEAAGGELLGDVRIDPSVFGPDAFERLAEVVDVVDAVDEVPADGEGTSAAELAQVAFGDLLARRLVTALDAVAAGGGTSGAEVLRGAFGDLEDEGLVDLLVLGREPLVATVADVVVLVDRNVEHDVGGVIERLIGVAGDPGDAPIGEPGVAVGADVLVAEVGRVLAGNETPAPSVVAAIRDDGRLRDEVSTVDNAETFLGWTAAVLALETVDDGEVGHYGFRAGAGAALPVAEP